MYDGGFPKFYNSRAPGIVAPEQLDASFKYFYNAMRFIENPTKVAAGNRKVLVMGDAISGQSYRVGGTATSDFYTTLSQLASICGYQFTFKERNAWGTQINATLGELEQYCAVILFSTVHQNAGAAFLISPECIDAMMTYRENGNGIYVITDHGPVLNTIQEATTGNPGGFFATGNALITGFGAWFSGNYNRTPVNVGFLRSTYGDHPLYNGMTDTESIYAGGSESRVNVATFESVSPEDVGPISVGNGRTVVQVAAVLTSGEIVTSRAVFWVVSFKVSFDSSGAIFDNGQTLDVGVLSIVNLVSKIVGDPEGPAQGTIFRNGQSIGTLSYDAATKTSTQTLTGGGSSIIVQDGDEIKVTLSVPLALTSAIIINRFQPDLPVTASLPSIMDILREWRPNLTNIRRIRRMINQIASQNPSAGVSFKKTLPSNIKLLRNHFKT